MRSKRTIKPTQILDNSVVTTSKKRTKQKTGVKKNKNDTVTMNETEVSVGGSEAEMNTGINTEIEDVKKVLGMRVMSNANSKEGDVIEKIEVAGKVVMEDHKEGGAKRNKSYANAATAVYKEFLRKLITMPTELDEQGNEFVIFDKAIINEGCQKWDKTLCGYFIGHNMAINELRMGKPLVMDNVTVEMCKTKIGRVRYAREKCLVKYDWIPPRCSECCVFGHKEGVCGKNKAGGIHDEGKEEVQEQKGESLKRMRNKKLVNQFVFQKKNKEGQDKNNIPSSPSTKAASEAKAQDEKVMRPNGNGSRGKAWSVNEDVLARLRKSANKYSVLEDLDTNQDEEE
ncbi:hypothetical protein Tco_0510832 [Tanacetum coccineum]